jgi:hypothetical protein
MARSRKQPKSPENPVDTSGWVSGPVLAQVLGIALPIFDAKVQPLALPEDTATVAGEVLYHAVPLLRRYFGQTEDCIFPHCLQRGGPP